MSTSSYISLTSISAISGGAAYLTFFPRNSLSSWNILGRKIAVGVMVSGAIGWIIYWSFNKKSPIKNKKVVSKLTTIRKRRTSKTSSSASSFATASSKPSTSTSSSSSSSGTAKTNYDFISSPTNVSMTGASTKSKSPTTASTQQKSVTKVESNDTISKIVENKIDEILLPKLAEKSELLPSAPSTFLPTQEIVPKTKAPAKIAENESVRLPSNKNVEVKAASKIEPSKTLDKKTEDLSLIASAPAPETTAAKVESVEPSKDLQKIESSKVPEKQQIELPSTAPPFLIASTQETVVPKTETLPKVAEKESIPLKALDKKATEPSVIAPVQEPSIESKVETPEAKTVENVQTESMNKKAEEPSLIASTQKTTEKIELLPTAPPSFISPTQAIAEPKVEIVEASPKTAEKKIEGLPKHPAVCCDCGVEGMDDAEKYSDDTTMPNLIQPMNFPKTIILPMSYEHYSPINLTLPIEEQTQLSAAAMQKPEKGETTLLTPFRPILHSIYYAHRHALLIEDLLQNYQFLED